MSDEMTTQATLEILLKGHIEAKRILADITEGVGDLDDNADALNRVLAKTDSGIKNVSSALKTGKGDIKGMSKEFSDLVSQVNALNKAQRETVQAKAVKNISLPTSVSEVSKLTNSELAAISGVGAADRFDLATAVKQEEALRARQVKYAESASAAIIAASEKTMNAEIAASEKRAAAIKAAVDDSVNQYKRDNDARTAAYSQEYAAATARDGAAYTAQQDRRYATPNPASRNTANPYDKAGAQAGYAAAETKAYSEALKANAAAHNRVVDAAHAEALAINKARDAQGKHTESLIAGRYALYDVASSYGVVSAAMLTAAGYAVKVAADHETAFTAVERTTEGTQAQLASLKDELVELSTTTPLTFEQLSQIATLGNQLGIAADEVEGFTGTVTRFSAVTGMTVEASATAFGSLGQLLQLTAADYEALGSSIALSGRTAVATEQQIVSMATRLAASANTAGFTAQEVIALSTAFASLQVAPERAQGVMEVYFATLNKAIAEGGDRLDAYAAVAGTTSDAVAGLVSSDPTAFFRRLASGLGTLSTVEQTQALEALGLSGIRAGEVFGRVSANVGTFDKALQTSNQGYAESTELADQYAKVADDLNTKFMMLVNAVNALISEMSSGSLAGIGGLVQVLIDVTKAATDFVQTPFGESLSNIALGVTIAVGAFLAYRTANILATASTLALVTAQKALAGTGAVGGIKGLLLALGLLTGGERTATGATVALTGALRALGRATIIIGVIALLSEVLLDTKGSMDKVRVASRNLDNGLDDLHQGMRQFIDDTIGVDSALGGMLLTMQLAATVAGKLLLGGVNAGAEAIAPAGKKISKATDGARKSLAAFNAEAEVESNWDDYASSLDKVEEKVRTLGDYANDIGGIVSRAFEIRFGADQNLDAITSGWNAITDATAETNRQIAEYKASLRELTADRDVDSYFLTIANKYKDSLNAGVIGARIAKTDAEIASTTASLTAAQEANSTALTGNTAGAIANRAEILGLVGNYQTYIQSLASSGMSQTDLAAKTAMAKQEFINQATALGYSRAEVDKYALAFNDVTVAIANVPRDITVSANADPAMQALNEFMAAATAAASAGVEVPIVATPIVMPPSNPAAEGIGAFLDWDVSNLGTKKGTRNRVGGGTFATGGYTGDMGTSQIAGAVHGKEFVFSAPATRALGVENLAFLHKMAKGGKGYKNGGYVGSGGGGGGLLGGGVIDLSAGSILALADALSRVGLYLYTNDRLIAESADRGSMELASGGAR